MSQTLKPTALAPSLAEVEELLARPLLDLVFAAAGVHREHHDPRAIQCSQLLSIKTGGCPEDCGYCSQSAHYETPVERSPLAQVDEVVSAAERAREGGADRFCMGAAWRSVRDGAEFDAVIEMVRRVKGLGLETCVTLGMLDAAQAGRLAEAGLDYYNHNLDTGRSHYDSVVSTRTYDDRLETLERVRAAGIHVCSGGILGLGESTVARAELLCELAGLDPQPESVPINQLVQVEGTPLGEGQVVDWTDVVRVVAAARVLMPKTVIRLSAGRTEMDEATQAMCFLAGANSIFVGDELLTTPNPGEASDARLFDKLGLAPLRRAGGSCGTRPSADHSSSAGANEGGGCR
ncbi:biotin synthase BioB [Engelhardtia mirabilis]|uniref:Biotin synthase n=1 Tax=Engelhardtia mirabilis TaxID=2528011 RepID=A0A518BSH3_9BACT|nr:Biotin synthase [Planctomycetes bacterium Pla133]QDV04248.1 Biotin synthase [Planctomycetes bacterium Pla86]